MNAQTAKSKGRKDRGHATEVRSPTDFDIADYRITRDQDNSISAQRENSHVIGDYSDTLLVFGALHKGTSRCSSTKTSSFCAVSAARRHSSYSRSAESCNPIPLARQRFERGAASNLARMSRSRSDDPFPGDGVSAVDYVRELRWRRVNGCTQHRGSRFLTWRRYERRTP